MKKKLAIGAALVVVLAVGATYAIAATGASTQTINACVSNEGQMRLVAVAGSCRRGETPLSWNTVGQAGPAGPQGLAGRDGTAGPAGAPGGSAASIDAAQATLAVTGQKQGAFSTDPIQLTGYSHEVISPRDPASGLATGKRQHKPIVIYKEWGPSTPKLLTALFQNENLTSVLIGLLRGGQTVATITLTNAQVASYDVHGTTEAWGFTYQKITWTWTDGGITAQDDWEAPAS